MHTPLASRRCRPCEGGTEALDSDAVVEHLDMIASHWSLVSGGNAIQAEFRFRNYYQTTAFVNAVAWIAHQEDHHPDINFGYRECQITYSTHALGGLSENDFICAAKVDALSQEADKEVDKEVDEKAGQRTGPGIGQNTGQEIS